MKDIEKRSAASLGNEKEKLPFLSKASLFHLIIFILYKTDNQAL